MGNSNGRATWLLCWCF